MRPLRCTMSERNSHTGSGPPHTARRPPERGIAEDPPPPVGGCTRPPPAAHRPRPARIAIAGQPLLNLVVQVVHGARARDRLGIVADHRIRPPRCDTIHNRGTATPRTPTRVRDPMHPSGSSWPRTMHTPLYHPTLSPSHPPSRRTRGTPYSAALGYKAIRSASPEV